jgi:hypothetical protein
MASGPLPQWQRPFAENLQGQREHYSIKGDWIMAKNAKPVKGKKLGAVKPLMKRAELPSVKPLTRLN